VNELISRKLAKFNQDRVYLRDKESVKILLDVISNLLHDIQLGNFRNLHSTESFPMLRKLWIPAAMIWFFAVGCGPNNQISQLKSEVTEESRSTRFPIVLHHGFLGFDRIFMIDYFFGVRTALRDAGYDIHATTVAPVNTIAFRAHQLASQIDKVLEETGASKVNIVAHSMGGLDARYLISSLGYGDKVASLTSIATPHQGSLVADVAYRITSADARKLRQGIEYVFLEPLGGVPQGPL
jgi:pimeloyl-ACP methyl ester carboxylesterase